MYLVGLENSHDKFLRMSACWWSGGGQAISRASPCLLSIKGLYLSDSKSHSHLELEKSCLSSPRKCPRAMHGCSRMTARHSRWLFMPQRKAC